MTGGKKLIDRIEMDLKNDDTGHIQTVYIDVFDNSLSRKWLAALNELVAEQYHLEKNYCFVGFTESKRNAEFICGRINESIAAINAADLGYQINDHFVHVPLRLAHDSAAADKTNWLHRYFEDLQGVSGNMSPFYNKALPLVRWHIRQLNLLCHEYESLLLSMRKIEYAPEWRRPSQLMCWLQAPRFILDNDDFELFGVGTICRPMGGVFVGVNKAVGKHHWEVFQDEGKDVDKLVTSTLKSQTEAAGDFDIEWARNPAGNSWMDARIAEFRQWLIDNKFNPDDKALTIGHPQVGQVDLAASFGTDDYTKIWEIVGTHINVSAIRTAEAAVNYGYNWNDADYMEQQVKVIS